ncbi:hypothetical protein GCM10009600_05010 [Oerskovia paurometabola]
MHGLEPLTEAGEPLRGERDGLRVAVDPHDTCGGDLLEHRLRVATHPERAVDQHGTGFGEGRGEEVHAPLQEDRHVTVLRS